MTYKFKIQRSINRSIINHSGCCLVSAEVVGDRPVKRLYGDIISGMNFTLGTKQRMVNKIGHELKLKCMRT